MSNNTSESISLPRVNKGEMSEFSVRVDSIDYVSDCYNLGQTVCFKVTTANNESFICNIPNEGPESKQCIKKLREMVSDMVGTKRVEGFEHLYPS